MRWDPHSEQPSFASLFAAGASAPPSAADVSASGLPRSDPVFLGLDLSTQVCSQQVKYASTQMHGVL